MKEEQKLIFGKYRTQKVLVDWIVMFSCFRFSISLVDGACQRLFVAGNEMNETNECNALLVL